MAEFVGYRDLAALFRRWADDLDAKSGPRTGILIPLYIRPGSAWDRVAASARQHPDVPVVAILNPHNGPGDSKSASYVDGITKLIAAGVSPIGYVATDYARRPIEETRKDVSLWADWYPNVHGVFLDEMASKPEQVPYYLSTRAAVKEKFPFVVGNPGTTPHPDMFRAADVLVVAEGSTPPSIERLSEIRAAGGAGKMAVLVHGAGRPVVEEWLPRAKDFLSHVYVTEDALPNPWNTVSAYFEETMAALGGDRQTGFSAESRAA